MATLTSDDLRNFGFVLSVLLNIYLCSELVQMPDMNETTYNCDERALGGVEVETDEAKREVGSYASAHPSPEIRGFYFSKKAFIDIFSDNDAPNGINFYLVGNNNSSLKLIMRGTTSINTGITCDYDNHIFIAQTVCPNDCAEW